MAPKIDYSKIIKDKLVSLMYGPSANPNPVANYIPDNFPLAQKVPTIINDNLDKANLGQYNFNIPAFQIRSNTSSKTMAHEAAHAMWGKDLSDQDKLKWTVLHNQYRNNLGDMNLPYPMIGYANDPSHSFASSYGEYASDPKSLLEYHPEIYNFMRKLSGVEFSRTQKGK